MRQYFVDSWFLIARYDRSDSHHRRAERLAANLSRASFITHDAILTEVLTYFSAANARVRLKVAEGVRFVLDDIEVVHVDRPLFLRALDLYEARPDKEYSLVDCMSMQLMKGRGITHVLTNDHHFSQEQFTVVSE
jgi:predicted nucleic acid-binding protein